MKRSWPPAPEADDFIEAPALERQRRRRWWNKLPDPVVGRRIGPYRVTGEVGRGGMGVVYEAVRADDHFQQQVAIKIVKRGMDTDFILRRFRNERQILAASSIPTLPLLLYGGTTGDGSALLRDGVHRRAAHSRVLPPREA